MAFTTFVLFQMVNVFNARAEHASALTKDAFRNGKLWLAIAGVIGLQVAAVSLPLLQGVFDTTALNVGQWLICAVVASTVLWAEELRKLVVRLRRRTPTTPGPAGVDPSAPAAPSGADDSPGAAAPIGAGPEEGVPSSGSIAPTGVASPPIPAAPVGASRLSGDRR